MDGSGNCVCAGVGLCEGSGCQDSQDMSGLPWYSPGTASAECLPDVIDRTLDGSGDDDDSEELMGSGNDDDGEELMGNGDSASGGSGSGDDKAEYSSSSSSSSTPPSTTLPTLPPLTTLTTATTPPATDSGSGGSGSGDDKAEYTSSSSSSTPPSTTLPTLPTFATATTPPATAATTTTTTTTEDGACFMHRFRGPLSQRKGKKEHEISNTVVDADADCSTACNANSDCLAFSTRVTENSTDVQCKLFEVNSIVLGTDIVSNENYDHYYADSTCFTTTVTSTTTAPASTTTTTKAITAITVTTTRCTQNKYVDADGVCRSCPKGTTNKGGDLVPDGPTTCDTTFCEADEHVVDFKCKPCAAGTTNDAGADATVGNSQCTTSVLASTTTNRPPQVTVALATTEAPPPGTVVTLTLTGPVAAGATVLELVDVTGINVGDALTLSDGSNSETSTVTAVNESDSRRQRRAISGTVTVADAFTNSYETSATVTATATSYVDVEAPGGDPSTTGISKGATIAVGVVGGIAGLVVLYLLYSFCFGRNDDGDASTSYGATGTASMSISGGGGGGGSGAANEPSFGTPGMPGMGSRKNSWVDANAAAEDAVRAARFHETGHVSFTQKKQPGWLNQYRYEASGDDNGNATDSRRSSDGYSHGGGFVETQLNAGLPGAVVEEEETETVAVQLLRTKLEQGAIDRLEFEHIRAVMLRSMALTDGDQLPTAVAVTDV